MSATRCSTDAAVCGSEIDSTDRHYVCRAHPRPAYFDMLAKRHLVPPLVWGLTADAVPDWQVRFRSAHAAGVEDAFLSGHSSNQLNYLVIAAEYILEAEAVSRSADRAKA
ncbi:hypothetical protein AB0I60_35480 [Actinosynnema sp. NPDC050436]|uniref:hypothetical protein n=1 Tax=Actinosynnema sp. NPDC050436 TaxID=3155659 RepID=UPI0033C7EC55